MREEKDGWRVDSTEQSAKVSARGKKSPPLKEKKKQNVFTLAANALDFQKVKGGRSGEEVVGVGWVPGWFPW